MKNFEYNLYNPKHIKKLLSEHGFFVSKSLGQNFLINSSVGSKMAKMSGAEDGFVLEIGPGIGALTKELAKISKKVCSVEIDSRLIPILKKTLFGFKNVEIINEDILKTDIKTLIREKSDGMKAVVCANLPYYITSPIIMRLLELDLGVKAITVMVQKEAGRRICAEPGRRECGAISLAVRYYSTPRLLFDLPSSSFFPKPDVDSSVIRLEINQVAPVEIKNRDGFFRLVRAAFSQRRKILINPVASSFNISKDHLRNILLNLKIPLSARAEQLSLEQFANISNSIENFPHIRK